MYKCISIVSRSQVSASIIVTMQTRAINSTASVGSNGHTQPSPSEKQASASSANTNEQTKAKSGTTSEDGAQNTPQAESVSHEKQENSSQSAAPAASENSSQLKVNEDGEFEPMRWIQRAYEDPEMAPKIDEKGDYIVSKVQWPTGEMAYRPLPRTEVTPRFGYNIISVKKPQTYWQYWRKNPHFNVTYVGIQAAFIIGLAWLMGFLIEEIRRYEQEGRTAGNQAGEVRGKGRTDRKKQKIVFTPEEQETMLLNAQESYLSGAESKYLGNSDYKMKKIARPTEYNYEDFRKR